jgi:hypothetical protein
MALVELFVPRVLLPLGCGFVPLRFGLRGTVTAPEQACQECYDAKDERADYNPSYGRSVDTGAVRLRGARLRGTSGRTRWSIISIIRNLSYSFSVECQHGHTTEDSRQVRTKQAA